MVIFIADTSRIPARAPARPDRLHRLPQRSASDRGPGRSSRRRRLWRGRTRRSCRGSWHI